MLPLCQRERERERIIEGDNSLLFRFLFISTTLSSTHPRSCSFKPLYLLDLEKAFDLLLPSQKSRLIAMRLQLAVNISYNLSISVIKVQNSMNEYFIFLPFYMKIVYNTLSNKHTSLSLYLYQMVTQKQVCTCELKSLF